MIEATGSWHDQRGAELEPRVDGEGRVSGTFRTGVGSPPPVEGRYHCLTAGVGDAVSADGGRRWTRCGR